MSNVLSEEKKQQVIALGKLGLPLRQIEQATGVRWETASAYLKAAGVAVAGAGRRSAAKPAIRVATDPDSKTGHRGDHRLYQASFSKNPDPTSCLEHIRQRLRTVSGDD
jgi:hypothetical protein